MSSKVQIEFTRGPYGKYYKGDIACFDAEIARKILDAKYAKQVTDRLGVFKRGPGRPSKSEKEEQQRVS